MGDDIFGEGARLGDRCDAEDFVARLETLHAWADGVDHAGKIVAQAARKAEPGQRLHLAAPDLPVHRGTVTLKKEGPLMVQPSPSAEDRFLDITARS
jgi:hypothetical protein